MLDIKEYLKQTKTVLLTQDAFDELMQRAYTQPEIIRCKECKYNSNTCGNYVNCDIIPQMFGRTVDNFCSMAERKTDEKENI